MYRKSVSQFLIACCVMPAMFGIDSVAQESTPPSGVDAKSVLESSPRHGELVNIPLEGSETPLSTWVVYPERSDEAPIVIVIHEILGLTDWVRATADQLAEDGFIALAPNMISGMETSGNVTSIVLSLEPDEIIKRLNTARDYGLGLPAANGKSASIGFCWGGNVSFAYAAAQPELDAAIVCYGTGPAPDQLARIKAPVLGLYGEMDARVTTTVPATADEMQRLGKTYEYAIYENAGHGFLRAHEGRDGANLEATNRAWPRTIAFLREATGG